jgi:hypothetical protein
VKLKKLKNGKFEPVKRIDTTTEEMKLKFIDDEVKARGFLKLWMSSSVLQKLSHLNTAQEIWEAVQEEFEGKTLLHQVYILRKLFFTRQESDEEEKIRDYLNEKKRLWEQISTMDDVALPEHMYPLAVLVGLSSNWDNMIRDYCTRTSITSKEINQAIEAEFLNRRERGTNKQASGNEFSMNVEAKESPQQLKCSHCRRDHHDFDNCFFLPTHPKFSKERTWREAQLQKKTGNKGFLSRVENCLKKHPKTETIVNPIGTQIEIKL